MAVGKICREEKKKYGYRGESGRGDEKFPRCSRKVFEAKRVERPGKGEEEKKQEPPIALCVMTGNNSGES